MKVTEVQGEALRFHVSSSTRDVRHLVDMAEYGGCGWCSCEDFAFRIEPNIKRNHEINRYCRHIEAVRNMLADRLVEALIGHYKVERPRTNWRPRVASMSDHRRALMVEYGKLKKAFLKDNPTCVVFEGNPATDIHHTRGRAGSLLMDTRYWLPVSRAGHNWIHNNLELARQKGFLAPAGRFNFAPNANDDE